MLKIISHIFLATLICTVASNVTFGQLTPNQYGKVDRTFGTYGIAQMLPTRYGTATVLGNGVAFAASPTILSFPAVGLTISKQLADGSLDPSFGQNGLVNTTFSRYVAPKTIHVRADGKIIVGGYIYPTTPANGWDLFVARYLPDGQLDTVFGPGGYVALDISPDTHDPSDFSYDTIGSIIEDEGGAILVSGTSDQRLTSQTKTCVKAVLAKFRNDGSLETSFGVSGISSTTLIINDGYNLGSSALKLKSISDRKFIGGLGLVRGQVGNPNYSQPAILIRYLENGTIDTSFGSQGFVDLTVGSATNSNVILYEFTELVDRKLLVLTGGSLNRLHPDGAFDETFSDHGKLNVSNNNMSSFIVLNDGSIITSGSSRRNTANGAWDAGELRKYFPDGSLDVRFGVSGRLLIDTPNYNTYVGSAFQLSDSAINVIGNRTFSNGQTFRSKILVKRKL